MKVYFNGLPRLLTKSRNDRFATPSLQDNDTLFLSLRANAMSTAIHNKNVDCHENPSGFSRNDRTKADK